VRSPTTCLGLWQDDGTVAPLPAGEFRSGDLVREISPRMIQYVGRAKDLIVRAGSNISPTEIEEALRAHPDVVDAGVAGVPDPEFGERVGAVLVLRDTTRRPTAEQVIDWLGRRLADYKLPELIAVLDAVPRNAMTKIDRRAVARAVCANAADE
jgi:acyl-CoA synthetase (AMP-forming)/AMP-acid ligase II